MPWHRSTTLINTHNQVASISHWNICRHFGVPVESRWYRHHPDRLVETDDITMMWDTTIPTATKIKANRPDICFRNKKTNCLPDVTSPRNMLRSCRNTVTCGWREASCGSVEHWLFQWCWELRAQCTRILHGGWTLFQVITTWSTYRKQCSLDPVRSSVKSCLLFRQP